MEKELVIKALEYCTEYGHCRKCPTESNGNCDIEANALSLIKELTEENESLGALNEHNDLVIEGKLERISALEKKVLKLTEEKAEIWEERNRIYNDLQDWEEIAEGYQKQFENCYEEKAKLTEENERLRAQNETLEIIEKDLRFRNKELQKYNEGLAKNIEELEIEGDKVREAYAHYEETTGLKQVRADTVLKMQEKLKEKAKLIYLLSDPPKRMFEIREDFLDQIAKELIGEAE